MNCHGCARKLFQAEQVYVKNGTVLCFGCHQDDLDKGVQVGEPTTAGALDVHLYT